MTSLILWGVVILVLAIADARRTMSFVVVYVLVITAMIFGHVDPGLGVWAGVVAAYIMANSSVWRRRAPYGLTFRALRKMHIRPRKMHQLWRATYDALEQMRELNPSVSLGDLQGRIGEALPPELEPPGMLVHPTLGTIVLLVRVDRRSRTLLLTAQADPPRGSGRRRRAPKWRPKVVAVGSVRVGA